MTVVKECQEVNEEDETGKGGRPRCVCMEMVNGEDLRRKFFFIGWESIERREYARWVEDWRDYTDLQKGDHKDVRIVER